MEFSARHCRFSPGTGSRRLGELHVGCWAARGLPKAVVKTVKRWQGARVGVSPAALTCLGTGMKEVRSCVKLGLGFFQVKRTDGDPRDT